jgi:hypothetical protein
MTHEHPGDPGAGLDIELHALPQGVEPGRDLWPQIESRLERPGRQRDSIRGRTAWPWQVAAAILLVAASSLITATWLKRGGDTPVARAPVAPAAPAAGAYAVPAAFGPTHVLSPEYDTARRQLSVMLQQRIGRMPASARQKLEDNLAELRHAAAEINSALAEQPGDPLLEELLLNTYQEELSVLAAANQLTLAGSSGSPSDSSRMQL